MSRDVTPVSQHVVAARAIAGACTCARVRMAARAITKLYNAEIEVTGLGESQVSVLSAVPLFGAEGAPMGRLSEVLHMDRTTLTRTLAPLQQRGLVKVHTDRCDRRTRLVTLTKAGEAKLLELLPHWRRAQTRVRRSLGEAALRALHAELGKLIAAAEPVSHATGGDDPR